MTRTKTRANANTPNNFVSVLDYGAVGDNSNDDTNAIQLALNSNDSVYFPPGYYRITRPLIPNRQNQTVWSKGDAWIRPDAQGGDTFWAIEWKKADRGGAHLLNWRIDGLQFTGTYKGIYIDGQYQGCVLENLAFHGDCSNCIKLTNEQWGASVIRNIRARRTGLDELPIDAGHYAIEVKGVPYLSDLDVIGNWNRGVFVDGCAVGSLSNSNIAGSNQDRMDTAVYLDGCRRFTVSNLYMEVFNNRGNGNHTKKAILVNDSDQITLSHNHQADGSYYIQGDSSRIRVIGCDIPETLKNYSNYPVLVETTPINNPFGFGFNEGAGFLDQTKNAATITDNWEMDGDAPYVTRQSNASFVTIGQDTTEGNFIYGDRSVRVVTTQGAHGGIITIPCIPNKLYTFTCLVKSDGSFRWQSSNGTAPTQTCEYGLDDLNQWKQIFVVASSTISTLDLKLAWMGGGGTNGQATLYMDTMMLIPTANCITVHHDNAAPPNRRNILERLGQIYGYEKESN